MLTVPQCPLYHGSPNVSGKMLLWHACFADGRLRRYFAPHLLEGTETKYQDGGTFELNPTSIALAESRAIMSARRNAPYGDHRPDYILNSGTGFTDMDGEVSTSPTAVLEEAWRGEVRQAWDESGFGQICGYVNSTMPGDTKGRAFQTDNPALQDRSYRFDPKLPSPAPKLDNVAEIPQMQALAECSFASDLEIDDFEELAVSNMFYIDIDDDVAFDDVGQYVLTGHVRSRWTKPQRDYEHFRRQVVGSRPKIVVQGLMATSLGFDEYDNFDQPVTIRVDDLSVPVDIQLQTESGSLRHISGSPFCMSGTWDDRYFGGAFGRPTKRKRPRHEEDEGERLRKRRPLV